MKSIADRIENWIVFGGKTGKQKFEEARKQKELPKEPRMGVRIALERAEEEAGEAEIEE